LPAASIERKVSTFNPLEGERAAAAKVAERPGRASEALARSWFYVGFSSAADALNHTDSNAKLGGEALSFERNGHQRVD
jgi:hypothetical protein